eukprot:TRINITY_DN17479_c2_g1_i1.p1 TRINITY_DN17479_c2_g1~~TRINITY_DN17479_c2_g1_i1.p1  ORF type:complete len:426 (+),score=83.93 TRINITY_DN17479_c2_g1_i1:18-1295(+)
MPTTAQDLGRRGPARTASTLADWMQAAEGLEETVKDEDFRAAISGQAHNFSGISGMDPTAAPFYPHKLTEIIETGADKNLGKLQPPSASFPSAVTDEWLQMAAVAPQPDEARAHSLFPAFRISRSFSVIDDFNHWRSNPELAVAVAAVKALCGVIKQSDSTTMMGLEKELKQASETLKAWDKTSISLSAGCDLFMRYVTRTAGVPGEEFAVGKARLLERGERFSDISLKARKTIAELGQEFVLDGSVILTHGYSRVVIMLLKAAAAHGKNFTVICTEGRPKAAAVKVANELTAAGIPIKIIMDSGVAYAMDQVDMVLLGADGVVESGGIINMLGTYQIAIVARYLKKPVYVAAESYKFARLYPLNQRDLSGGEQPGGVQSNVPSSVTLQNPNRDYTPPSLLTLLFSDLGVLTPAAVSDELIQLYL